METNKTLESNLTLENRKYLKVTGAEKLFYTTQSEALIQTSYGRLQISGSNISVKKVAIEQNLVELEGRFNSFKYVTNEKTNPSGLRIFKRR
ncbi:MAG: hypothetical protein IJA22_04015 [Clostridia bacterium]|nr:hypothetical protein [Clostridia bacterium]